MTAIPDFLDERAAEIKQNARIDKSCYDDYDVKRGLRNRDGTGVVAGLTRIGDVRGYFMRGAEKIPAPGKLVYRGIDVSDLIGGFLREGRFGFEETAYLLLFGKLPAGRELADFERILAEYRELPDGFTEDMIMAAPSADVMNKLARSILAMYSYDPDPETDRKNIPKVLDRALRIIARSPVVVANAYSAKRHYYDKESLYIHKPRSGLSTAESFLHSIRSDSSFTRDEAGILDLCLVLHAEHGGGNNSGFACRLLTSSGTDIYSVMAAAVGSLKGPRHGGASALADEMLSKLRSDVRDWRDDDEICDYLRRILRGEAGRGDGLVYGMGHAVYTMSDPRAVELKKMAASLAAKKGVSAELELIESVERLTPKVFAERDGGRKMMCANVDLYSGFVYNMLGIPRELYIPLFAVSRIVGWCAHHIEEVVNSGKMIRPAYKSISPDIKYTPLTDRC
ncbi:MAG: citrate synthase [Oscillospiraceae bacterium]|nr:citrate synthase [Oscillospiraceae bacterium]